MIFINVLQYTCFINKLQEDMIQCEISESRGQCPFVRSPVSPTMEWA